MRYFLELAYHGTPYAGWQRQPNAPSVQETLENALGTILRHPVEITGCGRTDTGVHARYYVAHFDTETELPPTLLNGLNSILPPSIAVFQITPVPAEAHARFSATERAYEYHIALRKDPFATEITWFYPQYWKLNHDLLHEAAAVLPQYEAFFPFCKTHSDVGTYLCRLTRSEWEYRPEQHRLIFHIGANRFLRGMVRLTVGACLNVALGQLTIADLHEALQTQTTLKKSWSVPPTGLFLTEVKYP